MTIRLALYAGLLLVLAIAGYALVLWGLTACAPPSLPGDGLWSLRRAAGEALGLMLRLGSESCFTSDPAGSFALWLGGRIAGVLLIVLAVAVLWELVGRELRRTYFTARGGHVVLAGVAEDVIPLARKEARSGTLFLAPDRPSATDLARARPFAEVASLTRRSVPAALARLGAARARLVAAATPSDLTNIAIADTLLDQANGGSLLVRIEQASVRALSAHRLSLKAEAAGRTLNVVSLTELQTRRGLAASMPGRYTVDGDPRVHIAFCGTGPGLEAAVIQLARQGLGLERERPLFSIVRTGTSDFSAGSMQRLATSDAVEVQWLGVAPGVAGFEAAAAGLLEGAPPLRAIHCIGADPAESEAMAIRWEDVLVSLGQPVPPIIAYTSARRELGRTGMIRTAAAADLAEAYEAARLREERARAVHQKYLDAQRTARGAAFGTAPAEVEWVRLPELYRDENRAVTDQMEDIKLARALMLARPGTEGAVLRDGEVEDLARVAHARWMAARALAGWTYGETRDDKRRRHPDLIPYDALSESARQKDRDEVASLATMAGLAGLVLKREHRLRLAMPRDLDGLPALKTALSPVPKDEVPVIVLSADDDALLPIAETLLTDGVAIELVLSGPPRVEWAEALRRAWRIHVAVGRPAAQAVADRSAGLVAPEVEIHALA